MKKLQRGRVEGVQRIHLQRGCCEGVPESRSSTCKDPEVGMHSMLEENPGRGLRWGKKRGDGGSKGGRTTGAPRSSADGVKGSWSPHLLSPPHFPQQCPCPGGSGAIFFPLSATLASPHSGLLLPCHPLALLTPPTASPSTGCFLACSTPLL